MDTIIKFIVLINIIDSYLLKFISFNFSIIFILCKILSYRVDLPNIMTLNVEHIPFGFSDATRIVFQ